MLKERVLNKNMPSKTRISVRDPSQMREPANLRTLRQADQALKQVNG
jgi:hypothetical protein